jgi:hypothetical protein
MQFDNNWSDYSFSFKLRRITYYFGTEHLFPLRFMAPNGQAIKGGCVTRRHPGTLARKLSRCKEGMAHFLPSGYRVLWPLRASWYRAVKELVNYPDAVKFVGGSGAVRVC